MNKLEISTMLKDNHKALFEWLENHDPDMWEKGPENKWTTGQHVLHLIESIKPFNKALKTPKFLLKMNFGKSNRETRNYDHVVARYLARLKKAKGGVSPFSRNPAGRPVVEADAGRCRRGAAGGGARDAAGGSGSGPAGSPA